MIPNAALGAHRPKRSLGQNFLHDQGTARKIAAALEPSSAHHVLEIGPGQGALTRWLRDSGCALHVLEKDGELAARLRECWPDVSVITMDALKFHWRKLHGPWRIIGNLPYNVASPIIWDLVAETPHLERGVFMIQKEVAQRLAASPGSRSYGALSVWVQSHVQVRNLFTVGPQVFHPRPKVDSAVVRFTPLQDQKRLLDPAPLRWLLPLCFQKRRKQLKNILRPFWDDTLSAWFQEQDLRPECRPENLSPRQFQDLARRLFLRRISANTAALPDS
ncbi:16S rRNA (adenine(1518)-N(6)/adenine(1519)-N(6))-dimethyltransferase RsmA [Desulfonatronum thioautotrophicum]|uniref:16S rRNA (adenine(1518)-N(6)/adenine(1519)-N(6))- dimethyltransferase RsmA n=1 Tax=Desulfonatronum thioautotrophicum TaxID=617001 RepID=UPI0005EB4CBD|nr:16S rRNA (adenine(1518)-N(6)/adenine(1519)-N(6))-dimethyltransferase RsmA [Desulfonatronum thioautotrophicum]